MMRVPTVAMAEQVSARLDALAENIAGLTVCRVERHWVCKSRPGLSNHAMSNMVWEQIQHVGAPVWDRDAKDLMRQVQQNCGITPDENPVLPACETLISPQDAEAILRETLPPNQRNSTSDDYTDMTWHTPTARFYIARPALKGGPYPAWAMNALGGMAQTIDPMVQVAAKVLACSALRLLQDEGARAAATEEFNRRKAEHDIPPLCDYPAPTQFKWPEYVQTSRGTDWHIPTSEVP
jgi:aminobenzoyl-glutamate utilization protein B